MTVSRICDLSGFDWNEPLPDFLSDLNIDAANEEGIGTLLVGNLHLGATSTSSCQSRGPTGSIQSSDTLDVENSRFSLDRHCNEMVEEQDAGVGLDLMLPRTCDLELTTSLDTLLPSVQELTDACQFRSGESPLGGTALERNQSQNDALPAAGPSDSRQRFKVYVHA